MGFRSLPACCDSFWQHFLYQLCPNAGFSSIALHWLVGLRRSGDCVGAIKMDRSEFLIALPWWSTCYGSWMDKSVMGSSHSEWNRTLLIEQFSIPRYNHDLMSEGGRMGQNGAECYSGTVVWNEWRLQVPFSASAEVPHSSASRNFHIFNFTVYGPKGRFYVMVQRKETIQIH